MTIAAGEKMYAADILNLTFFPKGTILTFSSTAWSATSVTFKNIWKVCNKTNHDADPFVPNLTDKFLRGAESSDFTTARGADSSSVSLAASNLPNHSHGVGTLAISRLSFTGASTAEAGAHTHALSGGVNSDGAHTHTTSGTAASAGGHTHGIKTKQDDWNASGGARGEASWGSDNGVESVYKSTESAGAHTHTTSGTAASAGGHSHSFTSASVASSAGTHTHTVTGTISGGTMSGSTDAAGSISPTPVTLAIVPSCYTVIYIIKVQ